MLQKPGRKTGKQTRRESVRELTAHLNWRRASPCVEQHKQSVQESIATYIFENEQACVSDPVVLAETRHWWMLDGHIPENRLEEIIMEF